MDWMDALRDNTLVAEAATQPKAASRPSRSATKKQMMLSDSFHMERSVYEQKKSALRKVNATELDAHTMSPRSIENRVRLQQLEVRNNQGLARVAPAVLLPVVNTLRVLRLDKNGLSQLPDEVCQLNVLLELNVAHNTLTRLPDELGRLTRLEKLNVAHNRIATLPRSLGQLVSLRNLDLRHNHFVTVDFGPLRTFPALRKISIHPNPCLVWPPQGVAENNSAGQLLLFADTLDQLSRTPETTNLMVASSVRCMSSVSALNSDDQSSSGGGSVGDDDGSRSDGSHESLPSSMDLNDLPQRPLEADAPMMAIVPQPAKGTKGAAALMKAARPAPKEWPDGTEREARFVSQPVAGQDHAFLSALSGGRSVPAGVTPLPSADFQLFIDSAFVSNIGRRKQNEDRFFHAPIMTNGGKGPGAAIIALFDGHMGNMISTMAFRSMASLITKYATDLTSESGMESALLQAFADLNADIKTALEAKRAGRSTPGSTAVVCVICQNLLSTAWLGDSRAVLSRNGKADALTWDHKPDDRREKERIVACGGALNPTRGGNHRLAVPTAVPGDEFSGGLAVSRALGDIELIPFGLSNVPCISHRWLTPADDILVLATDGLWDKIGNQQAMTLCRNTMADRPLAAAHRLVTAVMERNSKDNTTVAVVHLHWNVRPGASVVPSGPAAAAAAGGGSRSHKGKRKHKKHGKKGHHSSSKGKSKKTTDSGDSAPMSAAAAAAATTTTNDDANEEVKKPGQKRSSGKKHKKHSGKKATPLPVADDASDV